ncbi:hypothetical protein VTO73DRAFT_11022 [Trametes versicolor]
MVVEPEVVTVQPHEGNPSPAPSSYFNAQDTFTPDIEMARRNYLSGDSYQPETASPDGEVVPTCGDFSTITEDTKPPRIPVRYRSGNPVDGFRDNRYEKRHHLTSEPDWKAKEIKTIPAMNKFSARASTVGRGWVPYVHPEGQLYFRFKQYYTNSCLYDEDTLQDLEEAVDVLDQGLQQRDDLPESYDVVLETHVDDDNDKLACYYIADTVNEEVMWVDDQPIDLLVRDENIPILVHQHLKYVYLRSYWEHMYMFPHDRKFPKERLRELQARLNFYSFDRVVSKTSCAPWGEDELSRLQHITQQIHIRDDSSVSPCEMFIIARLKMMIATDGMRNYHGTKWARIESNRSAHVDVTAEHYAPSWIFNVISWMLFCTPTLYLKRLDEIWLDSNVNQRPWRRFISELKDDWAASITPSAVILTANVGFLAIQSVDQGGIPGPDRSAGQIVSYISTLLSIGNIIACTVLGQQHRPTSHIYAIEAVEYLLKRAEKRWQAQRLAVILSVPIAFFIWALLSFSAAILWVGFYATSTTTRMSLLAIVIFTIFFLYLTIQNGEWAAPAITRTLPAAMKYKMQKIPFERLTEPARKFSKPIRAFSNKVRSYTRRTSSDPGDQPYGSHMRQRPPSSRKPSPPMRRLSDMLYYGFRRTSEPEEISEV